MREATDWSEEFRTYDRERLAGDEFRRLLRFAHEEGRLDAILRDNGLPGLSRGITLERKMSESMSSLYRRGAISSKQMGRMTKPAILNKTKPGVPTKMADFDGKAGKRDQGGVRDRGEVPVNEIEHPTNQDKGGTFGIGGRRGPPTKGGRAGAEKNPAKGNELSAAANQKPNFPAGNKIKANSRKVGVKGPPGKSSGPAYGGPNSRANG